MLKQFYFDIYLKLVSIMGTNILRNIITVNTVDVDIVYDYVITFNS